MKVTAEKIDNNIVKLEIEVDAQTFEKAMGNSYIKLRKQIAIPGFRKGKAPRGIIERTYGEAIFYEDAINEVCPIAFEEAVKETEIEPVDRPDIDIIQIGNGQNLIFSASVIVKPDVELGEYKGIEAEKNEYNVTDDDVNEQVSRIQERNARWINVDEGAVKEGNRVTLDYTGSIGDKPFPGGSAENQSLVIGSGQFIPGFEEELIGLEPGDEKEFEITFPEDYHAEDLKGKLTTFRVKLHEIKEKELPVLDDEFAKDISEFDTLGEYKNDLKTKMEAEASERTKAEIENQIISKVVENAKVDIPDVMVERQIDNIMRDISFRLQFQGLDLEGYLKMTNTSINDFRAQYKDDSYNRVKTQLVLEKIAKTETIKATDEDIEDEFQKLSDQYKKSVEDVKKDLNGNNAHIEEGIVFRKTIEFLTENAILTEGSKE